MNIPSWKAKLNLLINDNFKLAKLTIENSNQQVNFKTLVIPVVDVSVSMSGNPTTQCKYSMCRMVDATFDNPSLITHIVLYDDTAENMKIDTNEDRDAIKHRINNNNKSGGTYFRAAFSEIIKIAKLYKDNNSVTSLVVIFLTDGQDGSGIARAQLVTNFNDGLRKEWDREFTVHTIGFTNSHDSDFLQALQKIGTYEGAYRYANPSENQDILSMKINSIIDVIAKSTTIPVKLIGSPFEIINGKNETYWLNCSNDDLTSLKFDFTVGEEVVSVNAIVENTNDPPIWNQWFTILIDQITSQILSITTMTSLEQEMCCEIVDQQLHTIQEHLLEDNPNFARINILFETLKQIKAGVVIDAKKIKDLQYEGKYATKAGSGKPLLQDQPRITYTSNPVIPVRKVWEAIDFGRGNTCRTNFKTHTYKKSFFEAHKDKILEWAEANRYLILHKQYLNKFLSHNKTLVNKWCFNNAIWIDKFAVLKYAEANPDIIDQFIINFNDELSKIKLKRYLPHFIKFHKAMFIDWIKFNFPDTSTKEYLPVFTQKNTDYVKEYIKNNKDKLLTDPEILTWTVCLQGKRRYIGTFLLEIGVSPNQTIKLRDRFKYFGTMTSKVLDKDTFLNCMDLSIIYGNDIMSIELFKLGVKPTLDTELLLRTCISNGYYRSADFMIKTKLVTVTDDIVNNCPNPRGIAFLSQKQAKEIPIPVAIKKGMAEYLSDNLDKIVDFSWKDYVDILTNPTKEHFQVIELLLKTKANPVEMFTYEDKTTHPLFIACEYKQVYLFKLLKRYVKNMPEIINWKNEHGITMFYIACYKNCIEIVQELAVDGADINSVDTHGDNAFMPVCRMGYDSIAEFLLEADIDLTKFNPERDNPVLSCCRNGRSRILEAIFKKLTKEQINQYLNTYNVIDGFVPIIAATELDRAECIKVCIKYGGNIEHRTDNDNAIVRGATSLNLACARGQLNSIKTLIELGANIFSQTIEGYTCLHLAIRNKHVSTVRYLLQNKIGKECLNIKDGNGRLPSYYANTMGNEDMYQEFFTNKLVIILLKLLVSEPEMEAKCIQVIKNYGQLLGIYGYSNIIELDLGNGNTLLTYALQSGRSKLVQALLNIGANVYSRDDFGTTPIFWMNYLEYETRAKLDDHSASLLTNVDKYKSNIQNKLLLKCVPETMLLTAVQQTNIVEKMNNSVSIERIDPTLLLSLRNHNSTSLLGVLDALKTSDIMKYILYDAKLNVVRRVASSDSVLTPNQILAIYLYTSHEFVFKNVNLAIENYKLDNVWNNFIECLYSAIISLPVYVGEVYRVVSDRFSFDKYAIGKEISLEGFTMCSFETQSVSNFVSDKTDKVGYVIFIIKSHTVRKINEYSKFPVDAEAVFLPSTKFKVLNHYAANQICLEQANIRGTTCAVSDKMYEKALNGLGNIVIEIEEKAE